MVRAVCVVVVAMLVCGASSQRRLVATSVKNSRCRTHTQVTALIKKAQCRPVDQPVPVPVPEGYEAVAPSVVLLPRCGGLACHSSVLHCLPHPHHVRTINITIYAYSQGRRRECTEVQMESHEGCYCECAPTCRHNQVVRRDGCGCQCDPLQQARCEGRHRLWDPTTCSCLCPAAQPLCSSGQVYIQELCRCENY